MAVEYCYGFLFAAKYGAAAQRGIISQYKVNDDYTLTLVDTINTVQTQAEDGADSVLGLVCDPFMSETNFDIYIHHSKLYQTSFFTNFPIVGNPFVSYKGFISKLSSVGGFSVLKPVISGLPVSNRDHGVNGGDFLDNGTLLMAIGGMTNQGYPGDFMGGLPESPFSGAILQAKVKTSAFPVDIKYGFIPGQNPYLSVAGADPNNAIYGDAV